ncbi:hypothetical protein BDC45DRAFT_568474 [Circinella umbellata]|nr:hypothetical protein BDC45DRAFT_568474 [Circinella umbellata]
MPDKLVIILPVVFGVLLVFIMISTIIIARLRRQRYIAYSIPTEDRIRDRERHSYHYQRPVGRSNHENNQVVHTTTREDDEEQTLDILAPPPTYNEYRGDVRILGPRNND